MAKSAIATEFAEGESTFWRWKLADKDGQASTNPQHFLNKVDCDEDIKRSLGESVSIRHVYLTRYEYESPTRGKVTGTLKEVTWEYDERNGDSHTVVAQEIADKEGLIAMTGTKDATAVDLKVKVGGAPGLVALDPNIFFTTF